MLGVLLAAALLPSITAELPKEFREADKPMVRVAYVRGPGGRYYVSAVRPLFDVTTAGGVSTVAGGGGGASTIGTNTWTGTQNFQDTSFFIFDDGDATKKIAFQASGITTANTATIGVNGTSASPYLTLGGVTTAFNAWDWNTTQTPDTGMLLTGTTGNSWVIAEQQDRGFDFAHAAATDPTLFIHSHNQSTTEWLGLVMSGTTGVIGTGNIANGLVFGASAATNEISIYTNTIQNTSDGFFCWDNSTTNANGTCDTGFRRVAAGVAGTRTADWFQQAAARSFLAADYTNATTTFSNTALSITVTSGRKYTFEAALFFVDSTAADGVKIDFNGGTAAATNFVAHCVLTSDTGTTTTQANATSVALATVINAAATATTNVNLYKCSGAFEPSGNGTFIIRGAQNAHTTGTLTIKRGSWLAFEDNP